MTTPDHLDATGHRPVPPPPLIRHVSEPPSWTATDPEAGETLIRATEQQQGVGRDLPAFRGVDPLAFITDWFGPGPASTKRAFEPSTEGFDTRRIRVFRPTHGSRRLPIDRPTEDEGVVVAYSADGATTRSYPLRHFDIELLRTGFPTREFFRRSTQENKPVATWLHTTGHHVDAESHHERTLMTIADFHPAVTHIAGQPITIVWPDSFAFESHTPDTVVLGETAPPLVVDVKTVAGNRNADWVAKVPEIRRAVHALGMGYAVWEGMSRPYRLNLENFTEARTPASSYARWADIAVALCDEPMRATELADRLDVTGYQRPWALTLIRRLLWRRRLLTDMFSVFDSRSLVERAHG